ncbi:hypothetical protein [Maribacter cobaltidurans]|uniref:Uncharacterized protein n=1 Tax=Maribacter cobaltidurans TaxID=1178778 RepID=A0A223V1K8_9FLAO|nr:hypothetical protein [Maribacter cobaltidurans]ASV29305.1 hypothetical protein CJ263_03190 [Maribacter cobaltidurans]GGD70207.1 hypothetical protein GCM10011412_04720 [Maribacter cobaltidurans]
METQELPKTKEQQKTIQLVDGTFTPSEASDVITALIDEKINFHKIQRLQVWEGNHRSNTKGLDNRIQELMREKQLAKNIIKEARSKGRNIIINGTLSLEFVN